ncbi:MAG: SDR family oxidoreductase [Thermoplasmata archaeon]
MDLGIKGDSALVTASSSGLGRASAAALAVEGVNVAVNGRDEGKLDRAVTELRELGSGRVIGVRGDLTDGEDITEMVGKVVEKFGGIDHLVTCAGGPPSKPFLDTSEEEWYRSYDLLVMSVVRTVKECVPYLRESPRGTIVNITSISVKEAIDNLVLSNSVRMAVIGLMKTLSSELAPEVRVNAVLPGYTETDRVKELIEQAVERGEIDGYEEGLQNFSSDVPLERIASPEELGEVVAFLSSEKGSYVNGVSIPVDGGLSRSNL